MQEAEWTLLGRLASDTVANAKHYATVAAREKMSGERILFAGESLLAHALRETAVSCFAGILKVLV
jgi:hypothetical protein